MRVLTSQDSERGGVLVLVAFAIPVLIMLASFVLDVGNWYEHQRHLQLQADAAALAGGGLYKSPCDSGTNSAIAAEARKYAGPAASGGGTYNPQVGNTPAANLHVLIN
ncbi:MAG TPA: pilus assembly protein TadG-related protein, partial [Gaiellales bacterium]|nr:pilus assembly protein TadG-related protein [Gaiellales bacterium]